jgi:hypothetical protein
MDRHIVILHRPAPDRRSAEAGQQTDLPPVGRASRQRSSHSVHRSLHRDRQAGVRSCCIEREVGSGRVRRGDTGARPERRRWAAVFPPAQATARQASGMGATTAQMVLQFALGETVDPARVELATEFLVRGSTASPTI